MNRPDAHRAPRTALVASALALVTITAHTAAGGSIDPLAAGLVLMLSAALAAGIAHRRLPMGRLLVAVLGAQALLHLVMTVAGPHAMHAGHGPAVPMLAGHGLSGLATAVVVRYADAVLAAWALLVATTLGTAVRVPRMPGAPRRVATAPGAQYATLLVLLHRLVRRGPPMAVLPHPI